MCQSVRNHIERNMGQGGGGNYRRGGPPPGNGGNGGNGGPPPGGNGRGGGPPPDGNDGGGRRGRPPSRGARNAAVPRRSNASARSDRSGAGAGPRRDPDSDEGASHPCNGFCYPTANLMYDVHSLELELWDAVSMPPSALATEPGLPRAQSSLSSSRAPQTLQRSVPETEPSTSAPQNCDCGKPSVEFTVRRDTGHGNIGRRFRRCGQANDCNFFEWVDELPQKDQVKRSRTPNPPSMPAKRSRTDDAVRVSDYRLRTHRRTSEERF